MSDLAQRSEILDLVDEAIGSGARLAKACQVIGIASSTLRRWRPAGETVLKDKRPDAIRPIPARRLSDEEREHVVETCNDAKYASLAPSQIVPALADLGLYIGSESTIYRELKRVGQLNHRGRAKKPVKSTLPKTHLATAINQVWMMDVTWLPSRVKGQFYYLYMIEDLFSRYGVHWEVFEQENSENTCRVIEQSLWRERCVLKPPTLHRDNGSVLKSQTVMQKLHELGIGSSHSRPRVSNDNAFIESMFRTLKYCPSWPSQGFESLETARIWVNEFMSWYNSDHKHSALKFVTPEQRHRGEDIAILAKREEVYKAAKAANPSRWSGETRNWTRQDTMTLNPEKKEAQS
jgi:putative transposase